MNKLKIVFMGTPEFAVPSLEILIVNQFDVVAVITAPDKPQGRGQKLKVSPVKECAIKYHIPVLQPTNLKSPQFFEELRTYQANLQIVVAFRMLPESVWSMPSLGTFNLHGSLLPDYRGAAPINWAIINGEKQTGITTFFLQQEIDTGHIIFQEKETIHPGDDAGSLYERLMHKGAVLVLKTANAINDGHYPSVEQPHIEHPKTAPKITKEKCQINWDQSGESVCNFIRGLSPYPAAWAEFHNKNFKIFKADLIESIHPGHPGDIHTDQKTYLWVKTKDGWISISSFQSEGKKRMSISDYFRGNKI